MTHTKPIFLQLKLLTLKELYLYKVGLLMFKNAKCMYQNIFMIILMLMQMFTIIILDMHPYFGYHLHVLT